MEETPDKTETPDETEAEEIWPPVVSSTIVETPSRVAEPAAKTNVTETSVTETPAATVETRVARARVAATPGRRVNRTALIAVALVAVACLALLLWWLRREEGAGRVVSAPRAVAFGPSSPANTNAGGAAPGEATLTLQPDAAARAGLQVEAVGEQLSPDSAQQAANGVVQANAYRTSAVVSLVGGRVTKVNAEVGQSVGRGQTLVVVLSDELAEAQSKYLAARAELEEHEKHHRRTVELVELGAASREELEQAATMMKKAESEVASERQRLLLLGLTPQRVEALRSTSQVSSEVSLPAPVAGTVISRSVNPGEVVEANKELMRVADLSTVWVVAQVYEKDLARVRTGSGASVTSDAYPSRVFRGRVTFVDPQIEPTTRTAQVRVELANPGQALKLGMYVGVAFGAGGTAEATVPTVAASAVQNLNGQTVVFLATGDPNTYTVRLVRLGAESEGRYPVLEGLFVGDRVVTQGSFMLRAEWLKLHPESQKSER
ncbi:MAG TPA: efflux RND transporter periplasmic adaptor subunit [Pyrinomonadaceae bacterium]|nr:efflux RND transporter periplasmic adaptor subunit [Pyrinomonadaceae bacterium]